jgi:hypothetical protein
LAAEELERLRAHYPQPQCLCIGAASEPMKELSYVRTGALNVVAAIMGLGCFFWCQVFTYIFFQYARDSVTLQLVLSLAFSYTFVPFRQFARRIDHGLYGDPKLKHITGVSGYHRATTHFLFISFDMLYFLFHRNLFLNITGYGQFIGMYLAALVQDDVVRVFVPMTRVFVKLNKKLGTTGVCSVHRSRWRSAP